MLPTKSIKYSGVEIALLTLPSLFWAGNFVIGRAIRADLPPFTLSFGRWLIAFCVLLPFVWKIVKQDWALYWQYRYAVLKVAIVGVMSFSTLVYCGLHSTVTANALLLNSCVPVLIMLFGALFYRQKLVRRQIMGLILSMLGVLTIIVHGSWENLRSLAFNRGDILVFLAMVCWAFYTLWMRQMPSEINRKGLMLVKMGIAVLGLLPLSVWEWANGANVVWKMQSVLTFAYVGVLPSVVAYLLYNFAVDRVGAVQAGLSIHLMPVFGVLLSWVCLGEHIYLYHVMGIVAIGAGLMWSNQVR